MSTEVVQMRLIPPLMILMLLLLCPLLATVPTPELNEKMDPMMVETTEYEVAFLTILDPAENYTYRSGEPVGLRVLVANLGTQAITDLQVEVGLWKSEVTEGQSLEDSWELQQTWTEIVVCADCYETEIESASLLGGSGFDLFNVQWMAESGNYRFIVNIVSSQDTDPTNNQYSVDFGVYQAFDIATRAYWEANGVETLDLSDNTVMTTCPGVGTCYDFSLNISFGMLDPFEEPEFEIRDIEVELSVTNAGLTDAFLVERDGTETHFYNDTNGEAQSNYTIDTIGKELKSVVGYIPDPDDDEGYFEISSERFVAELGNSQDYLGRVQVDGTDHAFQVSAKVVGFKLWQNITIPYDCVLVNQEREVPEWLPCEEELTQDSNELSDISLLRADDGIYEDLDFVAMTFESRLSSAPMPDKISQGPNNINFEIINAGSDAANNSYEYAVDVLVETPTERVDYYEDVNYLDPETSPIAYRCSVQRENHTLVGGSAPIEDTLCFTYHFMAEGTYNITARARIVNTNEFVDEISMNNIQTYSIEVVNNPPFVVLDIEAVEPLTLEDDFLLKLSGLDYDAAPGDDKNFRYDLQLVNENDGTVSSLGCINELQMGTTKYCEGRISTQWLRSSHIRGVVTDVYGAEAHVDIPILVWAKGIFQDSSGDFSYEVSYRAEQRLEMEVSNDVNGDGSVNSADKQTDVTLGSLPGTYDSVGVWKLTQDSTTPDLIGTQSLELTFPLSNDAIDDDVNGTLWYYDESLSAWVNFETRVSSFDGFTKQQTIVWEQDSGDLLSSGIYAVFIAQQGSPPTVGLTDLSVENLASGIVEVDWELDGILKSDEWLAIYYSSGDTAFDDKNNDAGSKIITNRFIESWQFLEGVHKTTYQFTVRTENAFGANIDGALSNSTTVDNAVDPEPTVSNVVLTVQDSNVLVTWESSQTVDVHHWEVCRGVDPNSLSTCFDSTGTAEQMLTIKPTIKVKWFYAVSAVDQYGNSVQLGQATLDLSSGAVISDGDNGETIGTQVEGGLPSWTYPAIGGVVLLSVIAGVILVVRGGGGDDLDQDWDY